MEDFIISTIGRLLLNRGLPQPPQAIRLELGNGPQPARSCNSGYVFLPFCLLFCNLFTVSESK